MIGATLIWFRDQAAITFLLFTLSIHCTEWNCPPGLYYDTAVDRCDSCHALCRMADIQGTKEECERFCPEYKSRVQVTTGSSKHLDKETGVKDKSVFEETQTHENTNEHHVLLIPVLVGVCVCAIGIAVVAVILLKRERQDKDRRRRRQITETACLKVDLMKHVKDPPLTDTYTKLSSPICSVI